MIKITIFLIVSSPAFAETDSLLNEVQNRYLDEISRLQGKVNLEDQETLKQRLTIPACRDYRKRQYDAAALSLQQLADKTRRELENKEKLFRESQIEQ